MTSPSPNDGALPAWVRAIDRLSDGAAVLAQWALLAACVISGGNAIVRFALGTSSNGWLEIQWYLFGAGVMLGAAQVLRMNEHVRVDLFYGRWSARAQVFMDLFGLVLFLLPVMGLFAWMSWPLFVDMLRSGESSPNAGGLIRWPAMLLLPLGFGLLVLQGVVEIAKRLLWLGNRHPMRTHYERPLQ
ncbi:TRAP-type mannitol/chloroaromatic compound transport system, small permease component [Delftia tsuruhatensis]|uniref:TRAP transporter small permease subunit n=1 Tax=Delftia tsuruhatensis TaxID=180282 RepID=UPI001E7CE18B|nr:TRAP transporter small permease subunit [Delftia tsuruhatensis]CAB5713183.1 TRAP-type mannitol/chloroaromatic compound transport system, small permease component [Delftia tsuruhatensis]CAC9691944.1 TRAP-type mannitol/chloroaromatic compound transport system, small permease component [Delftia tsuruhatensis]